MGGHVPPRPPGIRTHVLIPEPWPLSEMHGDYNVTHPALQCTAHPAGGDLASPKPARGVAPRGPPLAVLPHSATGGGFREMAARGGFQSAPTGVGGGGGGGGMGPGPPVPGGGPGMGPGTALREDGTLVGGAEPHVPLPDAGAWIPGKPSRCVRCGAAAASASARTKPLARRFVRVAKRS